MKALLLLLTLFSTLNTLAQHKSDSIAVVQLLMSDYRTMANWDVKTHSSNCSEDYLLVENGEIWDLDMEKKSYIENADRNIIRQDYFDIKRVRVEGLMAYAVYALKSDIKENGIKRTKAWHESAVFIKIGGDWKIEIIHSTPIELK